MVIKWYHSNLFKQTIKGGTLLADICLHMGLYCFSHRSYLHRHELVLETTHTSPASQDKPTWVSPIFLGYAESGKALVFCSARLKKGHKKVTTWRLGIRCLSICWATLKEQTALCICFAKQQATCWAILNGKKREAFGFQLSNLSSKTWCEECSGIMFGLIIICVAFQCLVGELWTITFSYIYIYMYIFIYICIY